MFLAFGVDMEGIALREGGPNKIRREGASECQDRSREPRRRRDARGNGEV